MFMFVMPKICFVCNVKIWTFDMKELYAAVGGKAIIIFYLFLKSTFYALVGIFRRQAQTLFGIIRTAKWHNMYSATMH